MLQGKSSAVRLLSRFAFVALLGSVLTGWAATFPLPTPTRPTSFLLKVIEGEHRASVELAHSRLVLRARTGWGPAKKRELLDAWYREQLKAALPALLAKWEPLMGVHAERCFVQRMKTRWGSCNSQARTIRLNTDLAKKPRECLEYIVVHELAHLLESTHNARFIALMDRFLPRWQTHRSALNRLPVRHEKWVY